MTRLRAVARLDACLLRWSFELADGRTATVDTTSMGMVVDIQASDDASGSTGDPALDFRLAEHVERVLTFRRVMKSLDDARWPS